MQSVGSRLDHHVDGSTAVAAGFGVGVALDGELIDGVDGKKRTGNTGHAALIDRGRIVPGVVVVRAVDLPVVLHGACAVD